MLLCSLGFAAGGWFAAGAITYYSGRPDEVEARFAAAALRADSDKVRTLLQFSCARDVEVERILLELGAGASQTGAGALAERLQRGLSGRVSVFLAERGQLRSLSGAPSPEPTLLERARERRVASGPALDARLYDACTRRQAGRTLWLLREIALGDVLRSAGLDPVDYTANTELGTSAAARLELVDGGSVSLSPVPSEYREGNGFGIVLLVSTLAGAALGALLGFLLSRPRTVADESVLATLEQAAERVAQGDLSSEIGVRFGGRADQTVRSFDRMTAELREMRAKLAEAERAAAWQDMAQRIAHEIKNPLSPIRMALETMRKAHDKRLPEFDEIFDESSRAMLEEVQRMERIVREFSQFARLPKARPGALSLGALVQETARLYTPEEVALELSVPRDERLIHADREQLTQVLINLIANGVHAACSGGQAQLRLTLEQTSDETVLSVEDSGPGVPPDQRTRVFEPYVTSKAEGTGLGLAIVRKIVADHAGTVGVEDGSLGGARFVVRLPG
jgi:signal transduction histidine kinase